MIVEGRAREETYPKVPNPSVVEVRFVEVTSPEPPPPDALIVTSPKPLNGEIVMFVPATIFDTTTLLSPATVDWIVDVNMLVETNPIEPKPATVDCRVEFKIDVLIKSVPDDK